MLNKRIVKRLFVLGMILAVCTPGVGQQNTRSFQIAFPLGTNLSQVQGDPYSGFRKWGLSAGVEGVALLSGNIKLSLGMLFQQLGAAPGITERKQYEQNYIDMRLSYIEVPVMLLLPIHQQADKSPLDIELGFSFARQLSSRVVRTTTVSGSNAELIPYMNIVDRQTEFQNFVWNGMGGVNYYLHPQVALRLRYHHGLSAFFRPAAADEGLENLRHQYLGLSIRYIVL